MTKGIAMLTGKGFNLTEEESINSPFWYLQYNGTEHGPLQFGELVALLSGKKLQGRVHFWRPGLVTWTPLLVEAHELSPPSVLIQNEIANYERARRRRENASAYAVSLGREPRRHPRVRLVATVFTLSANGRRHYLGTCIDVSARGLAVRLEEEGDFAVGTGLSLEVVPISVSGLRPFRVQGTVRWSSGEKIGLELTSHAEAEKTVAEFQGRQVKPVSL
jgi:hypothetical protein